MAIELSENDFVPLSECQFQHWGEHTGRPWCEVRPLGEGAAERVWRRTAALSAASWAEGAGADRLDLRGDDEWTPESVRDWLAARGPAPDHRVLVCYQPRVAVSVPWGVLCDHWLVFFWTGGCVWPQDERWVLVHDGDQFAFGRRPEP